MAHAKTLTMLNPKDWVSVVTESRRQNRLLDNVIKGTTSVLRTISEVAMSVPISSPPRILQEEDFVRTIQYYGTYYKNEIESIYPELVHRLEHIRHLRKNWDTYNSNAPSGVTVYYAYVLLNQLRKAARLRGVELPEPEACPGPGGLIQFDWEIDGKEFELKLSVKDGGVNYRFLLCPEDDPDSWEEGEFVSSVSGHPAIRAFLSWI